MLLKLKVEANAPFRICQLTDIHLGKAPLNEADQKTLAKLEQLFKKKQYNLIMLTGDLLWGGKIILFPKRVWKNYLQC